jgi:hypothetical protein
MGLRAMTLDQLTIEDETSMARVALYGRLKQALRRSGHRFLLPETAGAISWDRALFLNLTYWSDESAADVLCNGHVAADEIGHMAWHHVVSRELARQAGGGPGPASTEALFFSESIASAFDLYLIGRLLDGASDSDFITTQVPLIADRALDAGLSSAAFGRLIEDVSRAPERAFEDMRALLLDVANALLACRGPEAAQTALEQFVGHRFEPLLHHFEISNWILYARAYGARSAGPDAVVRRIDALLRQAPSALDWLDEHWIDADVPPAAGGP